MIFFEALGVKYLLLKVYQCKGLWGGTGVPNLSSPIPCISGASCPFFSSVWSTHPKFPPNVLELTWLYVYFMLNFFCYELWQIANLPISLIDYHCRYNPFSGLTSIHHLQCNMINTDTSGIIRVSVWSELFLEVIYELFHCWCKWDCPLYGCLY